MMIDRHIEGIIKFLNNNFEKSDELSLMRGFKFTETFLRQAMVCLNIQNIYDYVVSLKNGFKDEDFNYNTMPWPYVWFEFATGLGSKIGILSMQSGNDEDNIKTQIHYLIIKNKGYTAAIARFMVWINQEGKIDFKKSFIVELFDDKGNQIELYDETGNITKNNIETYGEQILAWKEFIGHALYAINFCHCKNIVIRKEVINKSLQNTRIKKGKLPFYRFNTIQIDPMKEILRKEGKSETLGLKKALHICRGHFATYTQEAPLFGRVTGTFWKPMHVRGNKKEGVVIKDYRINPPAQ